MNPLDFQEFPKMARLNREVVISEKIDGTNAQIFIVKRSEVPPDEIDFPTTPFMSVEFGGESWVMLAGSRNRWLGAGKQDNAGFGAWVSENRNELMKLGPGRHFGEWWGASIQRNYGLKEKRFSLFNVGRWAGTVHIDGLPGVTEMIPAIEGGGLRSGPYCCHVVPTIWRGNFDIFDCRSCLEILRTHGSFAAPGFMNPEGLVIFHEAAKKAFKVTLDGDGPKGAETLTS